MTTESASTRTTGRPPLMWTVGCAALLIIVGVGLLWASNAQFNDYWALVTNGHCGSRVSMPTAVRVYDVLALLAAAASVGISVVSIRQFRGPGAQRRIGWAMFGVTALLTLFALLNLALVLAEPSSRVVQCSG